MGQREGQWQGQGRGQGQGLTLWLRAGCRALSKWFHGEGGDPPSLRKTPRSACMGTGAAATSREQEFTEARPSAL